MTQLAVFLPGLYGGGAERTMLNLAQGFAERGVSVDLVVGVVDGPLQEHIPPTVRYVPLHASRTLMVLPALVRYIRKEQPSTLLTALNRANLVALWARRLALFGAAVTPTRVVISERNTLSAEATHGASLADRAYPLLGRIFYPWADDIVAVSESVADDLAQTIGLERASSEQTRELGQSRITTIYNPVVTPVLRQKAKEPLTHPWFEPAAPPVVLGVGRLSEQKDFGMLIRAFALASPDGPARLLILGEGPQRAELEALASELGLGERISLPGWVANPVAYMREASLFVLCSRWEGLPGVLIEALFAGVPVIATDAPGGSREILQDGAYGVLTPVGDVDTLAKHIMVQLGQPLHSPDPKSWQRYELERVLDEYAWLLGL